MKLKINLDTRTAAMRFVQVANSIPDDDIYLTDGTGKFRVHAKSMLGVLYSMEFSDLWVEAPADHYFAFSEFSI